MLFRTCGTFYYLQPYHRRVNADIRHAPLVAGVIFCSGETKKRHCLRFGDFYRCVCWIYGIVYETTFRYMP